MVVWIVKEQNIKPVEAGPPVTLFNGRHDPVVGEVPDRSGLRNVLVEGFAEVELALIAGRISPEQPAHLGRYEDLLTRKPGHRSADPLLGQAVAVKRRGVEVPKAVGNSACENRVRILVGERLEHVPERRGADPDARNLEARLTNPDACVEIHQRGAGWGNFVGS